MEKKIGENLFDMIYVPYNEEQESGTTGVQSRNNLSQNQTN